MHGFVEEASEEGRIGYWNLFVFGEKYRYQDFPTGYALVILPANLKDAKCSTRRSQNGGIFALKLWRLRQLDEVGKKYAGEVH